MIKKYTHYEAWKFAIKREVVYAKEFRDVLKDEFLMYAVFQYVEPLVLKMMETSTTRQELRYLCDLVEMPYSIEVLGNGNLRIFNV